MEIRIHVLFILLLVYLTRQIHKNDAIKAQVCASKHFRKGFTPLWYSIRHCRWVWVIRTTEMHQSSGNGRGPTQYFIIFRPPWLRILHEECPVYLSSQILTENSREEPRSPLVPPRNSWLTAGENPAKISCDMAIRDLASNRRIDTLEPNPFG